MESEKRAQGVSDLTKEDLEKLTWREQNGNITNPRLHEAGKIRSLKNCKTHLTVTGKFPSESSKFRCNAITLDY